MSFLHPKGSGLHAAAKGDVAPGYAPDKRIAKIEQQVGMAAAIAPWPR